VLALLGGAFIAIGGLFATTVLAGTAGALPLGNMIGGAGLVGAVYCLVYLRGTRAGSPPRRRVRGIRS
jgi:hypothetical protein